VPPLPNLDREAWLDGIAAAQERFEAALDEGRATAFDDYASESDVEFFAVASECFFQDPHRLHRYDHDLYRLMAEAWQQDPKVRVPVQRAR
jgi:Mlc titration factor MtfA (ptsG expression regulator)